jgi:hypothetical protein
MRTDFHLAEVGRACNTYGESRGLYRVLMGKPEGKRPHEGPRLRWEDNIKIIFREVVCECMNWIDLAQDRDSWREFVNAVMNLRVPYDVGNFLTS